MQPLFTGTWKVDIAGNYLIDQMLMKCNRTGIDIVAPCLIKKPYFHEHDESVNKPIDIFEDEDTLYGSTDYTSPGPSSLRYVANDVVLTKPYELWCQHVCRVIVDFFNWIPF